MAADEEQHLIRDIELATNRKIDIIFNEHEALGRFHEQEQSPLFSILPRELRDLIWEYALAPFEDQAHPFAATEYYYRPGHTARLKTDTNLLRTCRRVWLEANAMPMLQAEHSFYRHRPAPEARTHQWMAKLTEHNRQNFGHLHLFVQMCAIESMNANAGRLRSLFLKTEPIPGDFQPRMLHVTLRHTDWWFWESEQPLRLEDTWVQAMLDSPDLRSTQTFKLELETLDYKMPQLEPILERLRKMESKEYETHIIDGKSVKTKFVLSAQEDEYQWTGPCDIDGRTFPPYHGKTELKYHVTTLTWRLKFPEIPNAFVPEMRRAPRLPLEYLHWDNRLPLNQGAYMLPYEARIKIIRQSNSRQRKSGSGTKHIFSKAEEMFYIFQLRYKALQGVTKWQDQDVHEKRSLEFTRQAIPRIRRRWEEQRSLLKFEEVESEEKPDFQSCRYEDSSVRGP